MYSRSELKGRKFGPHQVTVYDHVLVLKDATRIATKIWFPGTPQQPFTDEKGDLYCKQDGSTTNETTFPAIIEYLPYCKSHWTMERDHLRHPWMSSHGYVVIRVDMRGSGDSTGLLLDEYTQQEFDDACEIIDWITNQKWSNGSAGMFGKSWGGFNGLQVAYQQPPGLKAVISLYSTDNRYTDDVHWKGGCLAGTQMLSWSSVMFAWNSRPPHPDKYSGQDWKKDWLKRLNVAAAPWSHIWMQHQSYSDYWKPGSICEDYTRIKIPILAIGGWHDMYSNAVFRMVEKLPNCRGIIGPWSHDWPDVAVPGPNIGFLEECLDFWDYNLKGKASSKQETADKIIWYECEGSLAPAPSVTNWPGEWQAKSNVKPDLMATYYLGPNNSLTLQQQQLECDVKYSATSGLTCGEMLSFGAPDLPGEQRFFNNAECTWTSEPLEAAQHIFGFPEFKCTFRTESDTRGALVAKLCDVFPDGKSRLLTFGVMNLCHHTSSQHPDLLSAGQWYEVSFQLDAIGYKLLKGHRLSLNLCTDYWPMIWTPRKAESVKIRNPTLSMPVLSTSKQPQYQLCPQPCLGPDLDIREIKPAQYSRQLLYGLSDDKRCMKTVDDSGTKYLVNADITMGERCVAEYTIRSEEDPTKVDANCKHNIQMEFNAGKSNQKATKVDIFTDSNMTCDVDSFYMVDKLDILLDGQEFFTKQWKKTVPRQYV